MIGAAAMLDGDAIHLAVALTLLVMSISSWTLMLWKIALLWGVGAGVRRGIAVFWQASDWEAGARAANSCYHSGVLGPLAAAGSAP